MKTSPCGNGMVLQSGRFALLLSSLALVVVAVHVWAGTDASLRAGTARVSLVPPPEIKAALGGYGARMSKPALGVHDTVWAKALVLEQGARRFALATADVLAFPPRFKAAVVERLSGEGWQPDQIMLLPSHTHTSLDMMALHPGNTFRIPQVGLFQKELFDHTAGQLAAVIREAARELREVQAASTAVTVRERNRNRRRGLTTVDPELVVTRLDTPDGKPLAALINWTAHPTFMDAEDMLFSGDWPGHLQRTMEALIGAGVTVLYYNGAEGDQSPMPPTEAGSRWERAERYGREMGIAAWRAWQSIRPRKVTAFGYRTERIALPERRWHPDFMKTGGAEYGLNEAMMREFLAALMPGETRSTCVRLGDLLILGVPGELAAELGLELKARAREATGVACPTIGGMADEWISYILSAEEWRKGGYEASVSFYGEPLGRTIVEGVLRAARGLN
ncbi:MAG: neutral/alkaline non-lysosomal ceramidase N-terminal domain-containing protein [Verrucomicrobiales bacterium]|nr:neutral/alkaline non-lysosomal ceramidase N-terminal domain-containing protein [Verrucomicrobiales bacterium]